jgi:hypothetical protein
MIPSQDFNSAESDECTSLIDSCYQLAPDCRLLPPGGTDGGSEIAQHELWSGSTSFELNAQFTMARAMNQYGLHVTQLWFNGNDQGTLNTNESLMQGVSFGIGHVPFTASTFLYPGFKLYVTEMKKYEPAYAQDEVALQGWESAALFVQGATPGEVDFHFP